MMRTAILACALSLGACATLPIGGGGVPDEAIGRWTLVSVDRQPAAANAEAYVEVSEDSLNGRSGCNSFGVPLTRIPDGVLFGPGRLTMMACAQPLMEQERLLMDVFEGQGRISVSAEGQLVITGGAGNMAVFER